MTPASSMNVRYSELAASFEDTTFGVERAQRGDRGKRALCEDSSITLRYRELNAFFDDTLSAAYCVKRKDRGKKALPPPDKRNKDVNDTTQDNQGSDSRMARETNEEAHDTHEYEHNEGDVEDDEGEREDWEEGIEEDPPAYSSATKTVYHEWENCAFMETQDNVTYNPWCEQEERDTNHEVPHRSRDGEYFIEDEEADWSVQGEEDDSE